MKLKPIDIVNYILGGVCVCSAILSSNWVACIWILSSLLWMTSSIDLRNKLHEH